MDRIKIESELNEIFGMGVPKKIRLGNRNADLEIKWESAAGIAFGAKQKFPKSTVKQAIQFLQRIYPKHEKKAISVFSDSETYVNFKKIIPTDATIELRGSKASYEVYWKFVPPVTVLDRNMNTNKIVGKWKTDLAYIVINSKGKEENLEALRQ